MQTVLSALLFSAISQAQPFDLINGKPVDPGTYQEVIQIKTGKSRCTATVIGPRVIVTAAHCASTGSVSNFLIAGKQYQAKITRHPGYPREDIDVALGVTDVVIDVMPTSVGSVQVQIGDKITLLGYGGTQYGTGKGGNDGILRYGDTGVIRASTKQTTAVRWIFKRRVFVSYDFVMRSSSGVALAFGDSGGPAFNENGEQVGVNSKGNIKDTSLDLDLTHPTVAVWLAKFSQEKAVDICGVNVDCKEGGE